MTNFSESHWRIQYRVPGEKADRVAWAYTEDEAQKYTAFLTAAIPPCAVVSVEAPHVPERAKEE